MKGAELLAYFSNHLSDIVEDLCALIQVESPSVDRAAVGRFSDAMMERLRSLGLEPERIPVEGFGDHVRAEWGFGPRKVLVLCHMDTVWPVGTIERNPVKIDGLKLFGPGVYDMKAGIVFTLWSVRAVEELADARAFGADKRVVFLYTSDEEVGSPTSRAIIEREARESEVVLVLEPPTSEGAVKLWRKGVADFEVRIRGRASHAGADPERGISAVREICEQVLRICSFADPALGTTVNVGVISGGSRPNVVAENAIAKVDVRAITKAEMERVVRAMHSLSPILPGAQIMVAGGVNRPPMERSQGGDKLYHVAHRVAEDLGFELPAGGSGGASDGNFMASLGTPTLDGLGAVGDGAHSSTEYVLIDQIPHRIALLVGLLEAL